MFAVYARMPEEELREIAAETIPQIAAWFEANPDRQDCNIEAWYGKRLIVKRGTISQQINDLLEKTIAEQAK